MFNYGSGDGAFLIVSISSMASDFPTDISLKAFHEGAKVREKNGQVDELKWLQLDGVKASSSANRNRRWPMTFAGCSG